MEINKYKAKEIINTLLVYAISGGVIGLLWLNGGGGKIVAGVIAILSLLLLILPDNPNIS